MLKDVKTRLRNKQEEDEIALLARGEQDGDDIVGGGARTSTEADRALRQYTNGGVSAELSNRHRTARARQTTTIRNVLAGLLILTCVAFPVIVMYNAVFATAEPTPQTA